MVQAEEVLDVDVGKENYLSLEKLLMYGMDGCWERLVKLEEGSRNREYELWKCLGMLCVGRTSLFRQFPRELLQL